MRNGLISTPRAGRSFKLIGCVQERLRGLQPSQQAARQIFELVNRDRAAAGLPGLRWDDPLAQAALDHARRMAQAQNLSHELPGEAPLSERVAGRQVRFKAVAENIATGRDAAFLEEEWMHSPHHRANILDGRLDHIGIAVVSDGVKLFAVQDFAAEVEVLSPAQVEERVRALLVHQGITAFAPPDAARGSCEQGGGISGQPRPRFVMQWQSSDLSALPDVLAQRLRAADYRSASVSACQPSSSQAGFTTFHIAVLLY